MAETHRDLVVIRTFADAISAHIAQAALDAHDIPSVILGDDAGGLYPALTFSHGVRIAVQHANAVRAIRVLDSPPDETVDETADDQ
ncbi:MAG: hypothetical protein ACR2GG_11725 [Gemmatimonadaceae bacterium]